MPLVPSQPSTELAQLRRGQHACFLYEDARSVIDSVAPYLAAGLDQNERCIYVLGGHERALVELALGGQGVDVDRQLERGALDLVDRWEVSFPGGEFDPAAMVRYVRAGIEDGKRRGFAGLRVAAEMSWALQMGAGCNQVIHYEALGDALYPDEPLVAVCMYDRARYSAEVCQDALRVHPHVVVDGEVLPNIYFEPPEAVARGATAAERLDAMLGHLERLRAYDRQRAELDRLERARAEAEAATRAREELLSLLAHELRNPLSAMSASLELAQAMAKASALEPGALRRILESAARQVDRQSQIIEHVLTSARTSTGSLPLDKRRLDLREVVRAAVERARVISPGHRVTVTAPAPGFVEADPLRLDQVLSNLLDNALKFTPRGETIEVSVQASGREVFVCVRDRGVGIPPGQLEQVFERYHRAHDGYGGLGLGLHLCRQIVRDHGGDLWAEVPSDGRGAKLMARLPAAPALEAAEPRVGHELSDG